MKTKQTSVLVELLNRNIQGLMNPINWCGENQPARIAFPSKNKHHTFAALHLNTLNPIEMPVITNATKHNLRISASDVLVTHKGSYDQFHEKVRSLLS
jgi:hypothetical protein